MNITDKYPKYLPLGSVILAKSGSKRIMITDYLIKTHDSDKTWDYCGCMYPEGVMSSDQSLVFNHNDIEKIFAVGYSDEEQKDFANVLLKAEEVIEQKEIVKESDIKAKEVMDLNLI